MAERSQHTQVHEERLPSGEQRLICECGLATEYTSPRTLSLVMLKRLRLAHRAAGVELPAQQLEDEPGDRGVA